MTKSEVDPANTLAGLQIDLLQKYRNGIITLDDIKWFLRLSQREVIEFRKRKSLLTLRKLFKETQILFDEVSPGRNSIDGDIKKWFDAETVNNEASEFKQETEVIRFKDDISHRDIIKQEKEAGRYQEFTLLQALQKVKELVKNREVEILKRGIIVYLSTRRSNDLFCFLDIYRCEVGYLRLEINNYKPKNTLNVGDGVLSRKI